MLRPQSHVCASCWHGWDSHLSLDELDALVHVALGLYLVLLDEDGADELVDLVVGCERGELLCGIRAVSKCRAAVSVSCHMYLLDLLVLGELRVEALAGLDCCLEGCGAAERARQSVSQH